MVWADPWPETNILMEEQILSWGGPQRSPELPDTSRGGFHERDDIRKSTRLGRHFGVR